MSNFGSILFSQHSYIPSAADFVPRGWDYICHLCELCTPNTYVWCRCADRSSWTMRGGFYSTMVGLCMPPMWALYTEY